MLAGLEIGDSAAATENRQPGGHGGPLVVRVGEKVGPGGDILGEEEGMDDVEQTLGFGVDQRIPAGENVAGAVVLDHGEIGGKQDPPRHGGADHRLKAEPEELAQGTFPVSGQHTDEPVDKEEKYLAHKEIIIAQGAEENRQGKQTAAVFLHIQLHSQQHQREVDDGLMEMIEEDIVDGKAGKGVQQAADDGVFRLNEPLQIEIGGQAGAGEFQNQQRPHEVGDRRAGEGKGQPEKGAAQQIERIGSDKVGAQVGVPVPENIAGTHTVMG